MAETNTGPMERAERPDLDGGERCGARTRDGSPCQKYPAKGAERCRFHGGASTGPSDTTYLEGNDHAAGNPGGGAPELNTNAEVHGGFGDWEKVYDRLEGDRLEYVDHLAADVRERAAEHAPDVDAERRDQLAREWATLWVIQDRVDVEIWAPLGDESAPGRGVEIEETVEVQGKTVTRTRANPAFDADRAARRRQREIAEELRLYPGFRNGGDA